MNLINATLTENYQTDWLDLQGKIKANVQPTFHRFLIPVTWHSVTGTANGKLTLVGSLSPNGANPFIIGSIDIDSVNSFDSVVTDATTKGFNIDMPVKFIRLVYAKNSITSINLLSQLTVRF
jgi:hypothetical protein